MAVFKQSALVAFLLAFAFGVYPASAVVINVEPDGLAGVINTAYPGVTLSVQGSAADVWSLESGLASTGSRVFGTDPDNTPIGDPLTWAENTGWLRADFTISATSVSIDFIYDDDDFGQLRAFDASDTLLETVELFGTAGFATATINQPNIAYIFAGSPTNNLAGELTGDALQLDNLVVTTVPIPAALPLFASALFVFGFVARRRRRQAYGL